MVEGQTGCCLGGLVGRTGIKMMGFLGLVLRHSQSLFDVDIIFTPHMNIGYFQGL